MGDIILPVCRFGILKNINLFQDINTNKYNPRPFRHIGYRPVSLRFAICCEEQCSTPSALMFRPIAMHINARTKWDKVGLKQY